MKMKCRKCHQKYFVRACDDIEEGFCSVQCLSDYYQPAHVAAASHLVEYVLDQKPNPFTEVLETLASTYASGLEQGRREAQRLQGHGAFVCLMDELVELQAAVEGLQERLQDELGEVESSEPEAPEETEVVEESLDALIGSSNRPGASGDYLTLGGRLSKLFRKAKANVQVG